MVVPLKPLSATQFRGNRFSVLSLFRDSWYEELGRFWWLKEITTIQLKQIKTNRHHSNKNKMTPRKNYTSSNKSVFQKHFSNCCEHKDGTIPVEKALLNNVFGKGVLRSNPLGRKKAQAVVLWPPSTLAKSMAAAKPHPAWAPS